jgi:biotin operon repressor
LDQGDKLSPLPDQGDRTGATKATNQDDQHDTRVRAITGREPEEEPLAAAPRKREPDLIFEAIANACGIDITQLTGTSRGQLNKAAKELKEIGATPDDVTAKAQAFRRQYEQATLTPTALAKHWPQLASATHKVKQGPATCPDCYQPLTDHDPEIHDMNAGRWT